MEIATKDKLKEEGVQFTRGLNSWKEHILGALSDEKLEDEKNPTKTESVMKWKEMVNAIFRRTTSYSHGYAYIIMEILNNTNISKLSKKGMKLEVLRWDQFEEYDVSTDVTRRKYLTEIQDLITIVLGKMGLNNIIQELVRTLPGENESTTIKAIRNLWDEKDRSEVHWESFNVVHQMFLINTGSKETLTRELNHKIEEIDDIFSLKKLAKIIGEKRKLDLSDTVNYMTTTYKKVKNASKEELNVIAGDMAYRTVSPLFNREQSNSIKLIMTKVITEAIEKNEEVKFENTYDDLKMIESNNKVIRDIKQIIPGEIYERPGDQKMFSGVKIIVIDINPGFNERVRELVLSYPFKERNGQHFRFPTSASIYTGDGSYCRTCGVEHIGLKHLFDENGAPIVERFDENIFYRMKELEIARKREKINSKEHKHETEKND